ncbi:MAG: hypothetical protein ACXVZX_06390, partial [Terriglobales bacterium]
KFRSINPEISKQIHALRKEIQKEFGLKSRLAAAILGPVMLVSAEREEARLLAGHTYEPPTFMERTNWPAKPHEEYITEPAALAEPATA